MAQSLSGIAMICLGMVGSFNKMVRNHISMEKHRNGVPKHFAPSLSRIRWNTVTSKKTLVVALKRAVREIFQDVVSRQGKLLKIIKITIFVEN
jgi:hypothetical protein